MIVSKAVNAEDVFEIDVGFETELDVVAEQKFVANRNQITRNAVVFGGDTLGGNQVRVDVAEDIGAFFVQFGNPITQIASRIAQSIAQDFVSSRGEFVIGHYWCEIRRGVSVG